MTIGSLASRIRANKVWRKKNPHKMWKYRAAEARKQGRKNSKYYQPFKINIVEVADEVRSRFPFLL